MKVVRWLLGRLILVLNAVFSPKGLARDADKQTEVNNQVEKLKLYQFEACPFCVKVRRSAKRLNLPLETRDAKVSPWEQELIEQGGARKVPCLRIEKEDGDVTWMYESNDIIAYLEKRFA
ncbi:glutathione S-transferase N-terminal domain-containing protein [Photobacterium swingsii]|uniref:Glutaredoxin n=1 Tax=Photobacterium swingsii TaxID=680026 RepID=A0A0J8Y484_9GAMM|nr:glutathione S-transferase N-terminal domain-containing protein [Photobacterium swingsii]KMV32289.1 glutaredoxin [Photobacterium swingsii]PSW27122.1 glutaredoxin [Photobacterium swingsii]